ncbi:MAG: RNA methyltransferase [Bacilli bacterium]|nr:RNA methyltransferase [Bacilli bacterium]
MAITLTSRKNEIIQDAASYQKGGEKFLVEGFHNAEMALKSQLVEKVFALKECPTGGAPLYLVTPEIIEKLSWTKNPEGIVCLCHKKEALPIHRRRVLYLDEVQDPGNVGTLLRTALAFGFLDVVLSRKCADPYGAKALMAGQGAIFELNLLMNVEGGSFLSEMKEQGYLLLGTALEKATSLTDFILGEEKIVLLLGNEGQGIRKEILSLCDHRIKIPIAHIDSLNVGVAGGILMHAFAEIK